MKNKKLWSGLFLGLALFAFFAATQGILSDRAFAICNPTQLPDLELTSFSVADVTDPTATSTTFSISGFAVSCNNIQPGPIGWTVSVPGVPAVNGTGSGDNFTATGVISIVGLSAGTHTASGTLSDIDTVPLFISKTATFSVPVSAPAITVTVTPPSASVQANNTQQFSATVTGTSNTAVTWAVNGTDGGNSTVGTISSNGLYTAPASVPSPATVTVTATSQANNTSSGSATVTVTAGSPPLGGTIVVNSVNSVNGGSVPNGSWDFSGPVDPCTGSSCTGSSKTYANQPTGNYILTPGTAAGFTMRNMEIAPVAMHTSFFDNLFAFTKNLFTPEAFAVTTAPCSTNFCSLTLGSGATVTFTIQWDPLAAMTVSPSSLNFTATTLSNTATVTNTGSAGSTLTWKASSGAAWATVSPSVGSGPLSAGGAGAPVTITVNPTGLASGATTNITFTGTPSPVGAPITKTVTVTYGGSGGSGTVNSVSVSCPSPINTNATSQCVPTVAVSGGASQAVTWTVSGGGTIDSSGLYTAPSTATTATVTATSVQDPTKSGTATIVVTAPIVCPGSAGCPVCTLNATPQQVVIPGNTTLTYSCQDVTSCSDITGTDGEDLKTAKVSGTTLNGSASGTPTENTTYSLTCSGSAGGGSNTNASVDVSVQNPGIIECGPGQPGCQ